MIRCTKANCLAVFFLALTLSACGTRWSAYTYSGEGFSVSFPNTPEVIEEDAEQLGTAEGWRWRRSVSEPGVGEPKRTAIYMVGYRNVNGASEAAQVVADVKRIVLGLSKSARPVGDERELSQDGCGVRELRLREGTSVVVSRTVSCEFRVYALVFMGSIAPGSDASDEERFFSSFRVLAGRK